MSDRNRKSAAAPGTKSNATSPSPKGVSTRNRILKQAVKLFAEHGFSGVGLQDIGTAAGLQKGSLFGHFEGKREIYVECVKAAFDTVHDQYQPLSSSTSPNEQLHHFLQWFVPILSKNRILSRLTLRMILDRDVDLMRAVVNGSFLKTHLFFMDTLGKLKPKHDEQVLAFFIYAILTLNDEMVDLTRIWPSKNRKRLGGTHSAAFIEALVHAW